MILSVLIQPNANKSEIVGLHNGALKLRIKAPPIDGKANEEVIAFLSKHLGISKRFLSIKSGHTSKKKLIEIATEDEISVRHRLGLDTTPTKLHGQEN